MNRTPARRAVAVLFAGFGLTAAVVGSNARNASAEPVPLAKPRKPAVSIAAVREAALPDVTARAAPEFSPAAFDPFSPAASPGLPVIQPFPGDPSPRKATSFDNFPRESNGRGGAMPINTSAFDPFGGAPARGMEPRPNQQNPGGIRGVWNGVVNWTGERAKAVKDVVVGPDQQPDPRVGQMPQPMPPMNFGMQPPGMPPQGMMPQGMPIAGMPPQPMPMQPFQGVTPNGRMAYAGNPAYRWYGWGTTTPGTNPYAPTGEYPNTSAQWYAMSRATPGAFPVPVTNPFRPVPGSGLPVYVASGPLSSGSTSVPPPSFASVPLPPAGPQPIVETRPFRYVPPDELPVSMGNVPGVPPAGMNWRGGSAPVTPKPVEEFPVRPANVETQWQPISYSAPAKLPSNLVGQTLPKPPAAQSEILQAVAHEPIERPSLLESVRFAAGSNVRNLEAKLLGRDNVIVRFDAPSDAVAEAAAKAISQLAELKPYTVTFDVAVGGK